MLKISLKNNIWFSSDTHYGHTNLVKGTTRWRIKGTDIIPDNVRDFKNVAEMNNLIVDNINDVVKEEDTYICLGDWSFGGIDNIKKFRDRIICNNIILICGNHDEHIINNKDNVQSYFNKVYVYHYLELEVDKTKLILSHFPICSWNKMAQGTYHLFGHVHLPWNQKLGLGKALDVGVDGNFYKPYSFAEVHSLLKDRPNKPLSLPADHHDQEWRETIKP